MRKSYVLKELWPPVVALWEWSTEKDGQSPQSRGIGSPIDLALIIGPWEVCPL